MYHYTSGWVDANFLFGQRHGRWEVRAKLPSPQREAIWPAIWLMNCGTSPLTPLSDSYTRALPHSKPSSCAGQEACWPTAGEIDIMEMVGQQQNNSVLSTYHWAQNCSADQCRRPHHRQRLPANTFPRALCRYDGVQGVFPNVSGGSPPIDFSLKYHLFAMEWTESDIRWFVDDVHVFTRVRGQPSSLFLPPVPMYLILNTAVAYWFKPPPAWTEEVFFRVDWVRVYERVHVAQ